MTTDPSKDTGEFVPPAAPSGVLAARPVAEKAHVDLAALSHTGIVRPRNEDIYLIGRAERSWQTLLTNLPDGSIPIRKTDEGFGMLVADGMGGMAGGDVASRLAVMTLIHLVLDTPDWIMRIGSEEGEEVMERIARRFRQVDTTLRDEAETDAALVGMGTTMTLAYSLGRDVFLGHIGDSRAYLRRGETLHQLTRDHTLAQELAASGAIQPDEVASHRFRHVLTRALGGTGRSFEADIQRLRLCDGDQVVLCTDGLTEMVDGAAIDSVLRASPTAQIACQSLVDLALKNGGEDNVTVAVAQYHFVREP